MTTCAELCPKRRMQQIYVGLRDRLLHTINQTEPRFRYG
jgi:hypothetical protein